jgi:flagellar basal-body rod protein FlgG
MIRGIYSAASGMLVGVARQDVWANNLANAQTPGYRQDEAILRSFPEALVRRFEAANPAGALIGVMGHGADVAAVHTSDLPGRYVDTGERLDLALDGAAFMAVDTPQGLRYTRNGRLSVDPDGFLTSAAGGRLVAAGGGPIHVGEDAQPVIAPDGTVTVAGESVGRISLWTFADTDAIRKQGNHYYTAGEAQPSAGETRVLQGRVELPNTDLITAMSEMMSIMRAYEASQRALRAADETLGKAVNEVGRV